MGGLEPYVVQVSMALVVFLLGATTGAVVTLRDMTTAKELERLRAEWHSVIGHDLRRPLASILLNAQALARVLADPHVLRHVERIHDASGRLQRMVGDLMNVSRIEARRLELVRRRINIVSLASACFEGFSCNTEERPFELQADEGVPEARVDPDRITQVLENLLTNAP